MERQRGSLARTAIFAMIGAVVALPVPIVGPVFGLVVGGLIGHFTPGRAVEERPQNQSGTQFGKWVIGAGVLLLVYALSMDVSVSSGFGRVNNIGLMNDRQNYLIIAGIMILAGIGLLFLRQRQLEYEEDPFAQAAAQRGADSRTRLVERQRYAVSLDIKRQGTRYVWGNHRFSSLEEAIAYVEESSTTA